MAASVLLHALFFILGFGTLKGAAVTGGGGAPQGDVQPIYISLAGLRGPDTSAQSRSAQAMNALFLKIRAQQSGDIPTQDTSKPQPRSDLDRLFDVVDETVAARGGGQSDADQGGKDAKVDAAMQDAKDKRGPKDAPARAGAGTAASSGALWGQIQPCWDRLPPVATVPVTLEVALDARGMIATPPKIVRHGGALDERQLISEARALAAITACVPYQGAMGVGGGQTYRVEFAAR